VILSWSLRLLCLLLIAFGTLCAVLHLILARCAPLLLHRLDAAPARRRERILYQFQLAPALAALFMATTVCIPAYLWFEPTGQAESVSPFCLLLALAAALWIGSSLLRGFRLVLRTLRFTSACRRSGRLVQHCGPTPVFAVERPAHPVALFGFLRPFILVSTDMLAARRLHPDALAVALDHERSHALHRDNWKLLSLALLPRLPRNDPWAAAWRTATDWAADDDAVQGDAHRSLLLAETILLAARTARSARALTAPVIHIALTSAEAGLVSRIDRLLHPRPTRAEPSFVLAGLAALALLAALSAISASPWIHSLSESLLHFGRF
jgi:hypothetical protein